LTCQVRDVCIEQMQTTTVHCCITENLQAANVGALLHTPYQNKNFMAGTSLKCFNTKVQF
jgi:hypothetical protein